MRKGALIGEWVGKPRNRSPLAATTKATAIAAPGPNDRRIMASCPERAGREWLQALAR